MQVMMDLPRLWNPWTVNQSLKQRVPVAPQNGDLSPQKLKGYIYLWSSILNSKLAPDTSIEFIQSVKFIYIDTSGQIKFL